MEATHQLRFFFQAEDGIRDPLVTGVQTCALPISVGATDAQRVRSGDVIAARDPTDIGAVMNQGAETVKNEIGRASCRERVESTVVGRAAKRKIQENRTKHKTSTVDK